MPDSGLQGRIDRLLPSSKMDNTLVVACVDRAADRFTTSRLKAPQPQAMKRIFPSLYSGSTLRAAALILSLAGLASCTITELPDPEPEPEEKELTFEVTLVKMAALDIKSGEGEHLEIYGSVTAKMIRDNVTETNTVWSIADPTSDLLYVGYSDVPVNSTTTFTVLESELDDTYMEVIASLSDYDSATNPAEYLGEERINTPLSSVANTITLQLVLDDSYGQHIGVTYAITRL